MDNRPIIGGNFVRQPCIRTFCDGAVGHAEFPGAEDLHTRGFFVGVHQVHIPDKTLEKLVQIILDFPFRPEATDSKAGEP